MNSYFALVLLLATCARTKASLMELIDRNSPRKSLEVNEKLVRPNKIRGILNRIFGPNRIVGGVEAEVGRYPYMVTLYFNDFLGDDFPFCGGTLVDPYWVLSAAHCAGDATHILIGHHEQDNIPDSAERIEVECEKVHPLYRGITNGYDLMLMKLKTPSSFATTTIAASDLVLEEGTNLTVIGWGTTEQDGCASNELREAEVQTVTNLDCSGSYGFDIAETNFCAAAPGKDSCQGDSGGPIMIKAENATDDVQVGVVSWGKGCACEEYPGVYQSVNTLDDFISDTILSKM